MMRLGSIPTNAPAVQAGDGGLTPTPRLQVLPCDLTTATAAVEMYHYSRSTFGVTASACFQVILAGHRLVGAAIFGRPAAYNVERKYAQGDPLLELRRFCLSDELPRNSESHVLGVMLRALKRTTRWVLSYADPAWGHTGVIYRATGFAYLGTTAKRTYYEWRGRRYPDRNLHQTKFPFHRELRRAVAAGEAVPVAVAGKHIYLKDLW